VCSMREEIKATLLISTLLSALAAVLVLHHPVDWAWQPVPLKPPAQPLDLYLPPARFDQFLAAYGPPTSEEESPHGLLRPPLFTKWLDYEPEHLRVAFIAAESDETATGKSWVLISFVDALHTQPVSAHEAARRLRSRRRLAVRP
jgi:hypothetical protein